MDWFGESWGAPICDPARHTLAPLGDLCILCNKEIAPGDQGVEIPRIYDEFEVEIVPIHKDCLLRNVGAIREGI